MLFGAAFQGKQIFLIQLNCCKVKKKQRFPLALLCTAAVVTSLDLQINDLPQIKHIHYCLKLDVCKINYIMLNDSDLVQSIR